jgi:hypothetical protein
MRYMFPLARPPSCTECKREYYLYRRDAAVIFYVQSVEKAGSAQIGARSEMEAALEYVPITPGRGGDGQVRGAGQGLPDTTERMH